MPPFGQINKAIAYLRAESPSEDVSKMVLASCEPLRL